MPSFDTVSEVDLHEIANAVDQTSREVGNRYDFKGSSAGLKQHDDQIVITADSDFQLDQVKSILYVKLSKRGIDLGSLEQGRIEASGKHVRQSLKVQQGISQDIARTLIKLLKESKIKVQASIQGDKVRVSGKNRDDLQNAIATLKSASVDLPLQFNNFRD
ncbi:MAG: YajQ family cyclic di-GMP-binding protein [Thiogranum sp.]|nr:YajQ family cyclic di-GMP-binding protein [Thiogranum sp.]